MEVFLLIIQNNYPKVPKIGNFSKLHQTNVDNLKMILLMDKQHGNFVAVMRVEAKEKGNPIELPLTVFICGGLITLAFRWFATAACKPHAISAFFW